MDWEPYVGRRVVCISDNWEQRSFANISFPVLGREYTIRSVDAGSIPVASISQAPYLRLSQIVNHVIGVSEPSFTHAAFRPVRDDETDISILEALLRPAPAPANAREPETAVITRAARWPILQGGSR